MRLENGCYICTPQNAQSSLIDWWEKRSKRVKIYLKKNFKIFLPVKKKVVLLHPLPERHNVAQTKGKQDKTRS